MCHAVVVTVFALERASGVEQAAASVAGCDVHVAWAGVEKFAVVDAAVGLASALDLLVGEKCCCSCCCLSLRFSNLISAKV